MRRGKFIAIHPPKEQRIDIQKWEIRKQLKFFWYVLSTKKLKEEEKREKCSSSKRLFLTGRYNNNALSSVVLSIIG
jgi:hypothetical protein